MINNFTSTSEPPSTDLIESSMCAYYDFHIFLTRYIELYFSPGLSAEGTTNALRAFIESNRTSLSELYARLIVVNPIFLHADAIAQANVYRINEVLIKHGKIGRGESVYSGGSLLENSGLVLCRLLGEILEDEESLPEIKEIVIADNYVQMCRFVIFPNGAAIL